MRGRVAAAIAALALLATPAYAVSSGENPVAALKRQVVALKAKLTKVERQKRKLSDENRVLRDQLSRAGEHREGLRRAILRLGSCPVTAPNRITAPGQLPNANVHGNGSLWVALWRDGIIVADSSMIGADGLVRAKFGWWRLPEGRLRIEGRRLDAAAPPAGASIPDGYAPSGFQASGVLFPTEGCWEVTGRVADASLSFVVLVVKP